MSRIFFPSGAALGTRGRPRFPAMTTILTLLVAGLVAGSIVPTAGASLSGQVRNGQNGRPVAGAMVEIEGSGRMVLSDSSGAFFFDSVAAGSINLLVFAENMEPRTLNDVFISGNAEKRIDIELNHQLVSLDTIKVRGTAFRKAPDMAASTKTMTFDEILRSPGALVDVQRAVQNLPSVSSAGDNTNEIIVRGGNRGENLVIMDNIELPNPNHFADQGSGGGVVSLINPLLVKGLTFSAGAPPAQYGGKASSVLDVKLRDGNTAIVLGGVDVGMAGAGIHMEGPLWKNASFMASATKSYLGMFAHFARTTAVPDYWGGQAKLAQKLGSHKLSGNFIYGRNGITIQNAAEDAGTDGDHVDAGGIIYASGCNWETDWSDRLSSVTTVSAVGNSFDRLEYSDTSMSGGDIPDTFFVNNSIEREQVLKTVWSLQVGEKGLLSAGVSAKRCDFDEAMRDLSPAENGFDTMVTSLDGIGYKCGVFASGILYPVDRLKIIPGLRCDYFTFNRSSTVAPRLGLVYSAGADIDITASGGLQYQEPDYAMLAADPGNRSMKPRRVATGIAGVEYAFTEIAARCVAELFYKNYHNTPVPYALTTADPLDESDRWLSNGSGYSLGIELFATKKLTDHFFGSAAASFSRSWQRDPRAGHSGEWLRGEYDFRTMITLTGGYKIDLIEKEWYKRMHDHWWLAALSPVFPLADRVELSARWRYLGGRPRTLYLDETGDELGDYGYLDAEYPDYHRLDLRFERRFGFGFLQMIYYFDLQHVYSRWKKNIWSYMYSRIRRTETPVYQFPFFPAGGVIIGF
ncbi:MAG: TonB-dependent receptor [Chitinispirillaceae bacterium]|nr:TonB-dependent receptor [Chitinispirillaceae bacterium]